VEDMMAELGDASINLEQVFWRKCTMLEQMSIWDKAWLDISFVWGVFVPLQNSGCGIVHHLRTFQRLSALSQTEECSQTFSPGNNKVSIYQITFNGCSANGAIRYPRDGNARSTKV
jgi:hypothetical protein